MTPGATSTGDGPRLSGFTIYLANIPNENAPMPSPDTTIPETNPFLPGKWLQAALSGAGYIKPFPIPKPTAYKTKNKCTFRVVVDIRVSPTAKKPPTKITARDPKIEDKRIPIGKNIVLSKTIKGRTKKNWLKFVSTPLSLK